MNYTCLSCKFFKKYPKYNTRIQVSYYCKKNMEPLINFHKPCKYFDYKYKKCVIIEKEEIQEYLL